MTQVRVCIFATRADLALHLANMYAADPDPQARWKPVPGTCGDYEVCPGTDRYPMGRVRSWTTRSWGADLTVYLNAYGYPSVTIGNQRWQVHQLILAAFAGPCPAGMESRHLDDCKTNNRWPGNLCYGTRGQNQQDRVRNGHHDKAARTSCPRCGEPYAGDNLYIYPDGHRGCRACERRWGTEYEARNRDRRNARRREQRASGAWR